MNLWNLDMKVYFFVEIMVDIWKHGQGTHCTKMDADKSAKNYPQCPKAYLPNFPGQA